MYGSRMSKKAMLFGCGFLMFSVSFLAAQSDPVTQSSGRSDSSAFDRYTGCKFSDGLSVVETSPLEPVIHERTVQTSKGPKQVPMVEGRRVMFAYPGKDFFANVKVEILPEKDYAETRQTLVDNFDYMLATSKDSARNYELKSKLNGLDVRGLDRDKLEGGVLGIYVMLNDASRVVTTIYFLNQEPKDRSFQTIEQYHAARGRFLSTYAACIGTKD
jgi:hypothetical protein